MWTILLYGVVSFLVTYFLHRRERFKVVRKGEIRILIVIGVILSFVDIVETWFGYEHEGNPFVILTIQLLAEGGWAIFVFSHLVLSIFIALLGLKGRSEEEVIVRAALFGIVVYLVILTVINALSLGIYTFF